jgi:hypothetical protein
MTHKTYLAHSFVDPRIILGDSKIHGKGLIAEKEIQEGETVMIWGGITVPKDKYNPDNFHEASIIPVDAHTYLGLPITDDSPTLDEYLNHSCDPNTWMRDEVTIVARRKIPAGEEVTLDCAMWDADDSAPYSDDGTCSCGTPLCRKNLSHHDWKRPELQKRYEGHFSPYIAKMISDSVA